MSWIKVCTLQEIIPRKLKRIEVGGKVLLLVCISGKWFCCENKCTHENGAFGEEDLQGTTLTCSRHGAQFEISNGKVLCGPAFEPLKRYKIKVENDDIFVQLEDESGEE